MVNVSCVKLITGRVLREATVQSMIDDFEKQMDLIKNKKLLPEFLMEDHNGNIVTRCIGGTDVTKEWNDYLNKQNTIKN